MKLKREKTPKKKAVAELPAARIGLKPPGKGGRIKWIRVGFAWDLFVLAPLLGIPLFWRKLHPWGATILSLLLIWIVLGVALNGATRWLDAMFGVIFFLFDLFLGLYGNRLTAQAYLRHGWTVDHPDYAATRKVIARWQLDTE